MSWLLQRPLGRHLHPVVLPLLQRDAVPLALVELAAEGVEAVEAHGHHLVVLHRDHPLAGLVVTQEGEILSRDVGTMREGSGLNSAFIMLLCVQGEPSGR